MLPRRNSNMGGAKIALWAHDNGKDLNSDTLCTTYLLKKKKYNKGIQTRVLSDFT